MPRARRRRLLLRGATGLVAVTLAACQPAWRSALSDDLADARERWASSADATVTYTVTQTVCGGCDAGTPTEVPIVWADRQASTTAATDPTGYSPSRLFDLAEDAIQQAADDGDVTLAFDDATGLPTRIDLTRDDADDGDHGFTIEVATVE